MLTVQLVCSAIQYNLYAVLVVETYIWEMNSNRPPKIHGLHKRPSHALTPCSMAYLNIHVCSSAHQHLDNLQVAPVTGPV